MHHIKRIAIFCFLAFIIVFPLFSQQELENWQHQSSKDDFPNGIGSAEWYQAAKPAARRIVVAILDTGIDIDHPDLKPNIWVNPDELNGNKKDDDNNGYVDDIHGWNFLGGADGRSVVKESLEVTRLYGQEKAKWEGKDPAKLSAAEKQQYQRYLEMKDVVETKIENAKSHIDEVHQMETIIMTALNSAKKEFGDEPLNVEKLEQSANEDAQMAAKIIRNVEEQGLKVESIDWLIAVAKEQFVEQLKADEDNLNYSYNVDYNPRAEIIKDNYTDFSNRHYGNNDVDGAFSFHGTHVAGIIGAVRDNGIGMNGIADNVALMSVRLVPDGDERDKDVANGIRYAVDNGAEVINMSFGKGYSPEKRLVDEAMRYAAKKDVLLVIGSGNEGENMDAKPNFPNDTEVGKSKPRIRNLISVGALSPDSEESSIAEFSNYGKKSVDVFAPGVYIYSTTPDSTYDYASGTSMAAPVVSGVAALIRSRYPKLTAAQVKDVIVKSARKLPAKVIQPGTFEEVPSSVLSVSGGSIDVPAAMQMASKIKGKRKASVMPAEYVKPMNKV